MLIISGLCECALIKESSHAAFWTGGDLKKIKIKKEEGKKPLLKRLLAWNIVEYLPPWLDEKGSQRVIKVKAHSETALPRKAIITERGLFKWKLSKEAAAHA